MIKKLPFKINFPIKTLTKTKINLSRNNIENILKRNIYSQFYQCNNNNILRERFDLFLELGKEIEKLINKKHPSLKILNISAFGSSLYLKNPKDYDFLVIVKCQSFILEEEILIFKKKKYSLGISIKGIDNFNKGRIDIENKVPINFQKQIQNRTLSALYYRHIPLIGYDFCKNEKIFIDNILSQVSDLIYYAYDMHYKNNIFNLSNEERAKKIISRMYEASSYLSHLYPNCEKIKKSIYLLTKNKISLKESKKYIITIKNIYEEKLNRKLNLEKNVLNILKDSKIKNNIIERLEKYWETAKLPHIWIEKIFDILTSNIENENIAIKKVRNEFASIFNPNSKEYSKKLVDFRKIKVKNLSKRIHHEITGNIIADIGGMGEDFMSEILKLNKNIKKAYVTDLKIFSKSKNNPKIIFSVQPSYTKTYLKKESLDTIIICMVLHHVNDINQNKLVKHLISRLKKNGRIIIIEDTYPENYTGLSLNKNMREYLSFSKDIKNRILCFYDWFGNTLMRNSDNLDLIYNYKTMEEWKLFFKKMSLMEVKSEFIVENQKKPDLFRPKAILVFKKR